MRNAPISKRELLAYQADVKGSIFRQIRQRFARLKENGFTQKDLATKIGMNEGQLSRRLRGDYDLRLETLSDLARGLDCRIAVTLVPLANVALFEPRPASSSSSAYGTATGASKQYEEVLAPLKWRSLKDTADCVFAPLAKMKLYTKTVGPVRCRRERGSKLQFLDRTRRAHFHDANLPIGKHVGGYR